MLFKRRYHCDPNQVTTRFKDGLLQVHLAKKEITKPKSREIKIS